MNSELITPNWYPQDVYTKDLRTSEWLFEIWKRYKFNNDEILPHSIRLLTPGERKEAFRTFVLSKDIKSFLSLLQPTPQRPIRDISISDVFRMHDLIITSTWYTSHPDKVAFEDTMNALKNNKELTQKQKQVFDKMYNIPWHAFHKNTSKQSWYPNKDISHLSGIPVTIDPGYEKKGMTEYLKKLLFQWVGKLQNIEEHFAQWHATQILAVFDLTTWFKLEGIEYHNIRLHKLIWPSGRISITKNKEVEPNEDIANILALTEKIISHHTVRKLMLLTEAKIKKTTIKP